MSDLLNPDRLKALGNTGLLDSLPEAAFDRLTRIAARMLHAPTALVSLVDGERQFFKSAVGLGEPCASLRETPLSRSFCKTVVETGAPLVVFDAREHPSLKNNPAVSELNVIAYAGIPLISAGHQTLGSLCVIDTKPRAWSDDEVETLRDLAASVVTEIELRTMARTLRESDKMYRKLASNIPHGAVFIFDKDMRYELAEGSALQAVTKRQGYEFVGKIATDVASSHNKQIVRETYSAALAGETRDTELCYNNEFLLAVHTAPIISDNGQIEHGMAFLYDVTGRKNLEIMLRSQTDLLGSVLENMSEGVLVADASGKIIVANAAICCLSGANQTNLDDAYGQLSFYNTQGAALSHDELPLTRAMRGERVDLMELLVRSPMFPDGHWQSISAAPLPRADKSMGGICVMRDLTEVHKAQRDLAVQTEYVTLLSTVSDEVNRASNLDEAMLNCLRIICEHANFALGHVFLRDSAEGHLTSTELWWADDLQRYTKFQEATNRIDFAPGVGFPGRVVEQGDAASTLDLAQDMRWERAPDAIAAGLLSGIAFPVWVGDEVAAVLEFFSRNDERPNPRLLYVMVSVGAQIGRIIERERYASRVEALSLSDELTTLSNRRGFLMLATQQMRMAERSKRNLLLLFADLDGLKPINDKLGHTAGDAAIVEAAEVLRSVFRESDILARLGGDEFVVLMPETDISRRGLLTERLEASIAAANVKEGRAYRLSMSIGVAMYDPCQPEGIEDLLARADALMYAHKQARKKNR